jgi:hypothetical protein
MRAIRLILIAALVLFTLKESYSIDTNAVKYYPLKVGNYWVYNHTWFWSGTTKVWSRIIDTLVTNGHKYYKVRTLNPPPGSGTTDMYVRIDSGTGSVRRFVSSGSCPWLVNETSRDSLSAPFRDSSRYECDSYFRCMDDSSYITIFGLYKRKKDFVWSDYFEHGIIRIFVSDIGMIQHIELGPFGTSQYMNLVGCYINGVLYGDTSLTGLTIISTEVPDGFSVYQNYPNPFNPVTKIRFDISPLLGGVSEGRGGLVKLIIFDLLGKEIATLVNEQLQPGTYEVQWDATDFPSGVYYYRLVAGDFSESKKMILTK